LISDVIQIEVGTSAEHYFGIEVLGLRSYRKEFKNENQAEDWESDQLSSTIYNLAVVSPIKTESTNSISLPINVNLLPNISWVEF
jgi:hypothetical protein